MMLRKKKEEEVEDDEELERLLKEDGEEKDGSDSGGYLKVKIEIEGLRELTQAIEELVEALRTKTK
ncbi:MAG: hypothetical protein QXP98_04465 [Thermoproteus sp.]